MGRVGVVSRAPEGVSDFEQKAWSLDFGDWFELHLEAGEREGEGEREREGERKVLVSKSLPTILADAMLGPLL